MDTKSENKFAEYLSELNNWGRSYFYNRADVCSNYFWKLKNGRKRPSPDLIVRLALATEGRCQPSDVFMYFEEVRQSQHLDVLVNDMRDDWVNHLDYFRKFRSFDLPDQVEQLMQNGYTVTTRVVDGFCEYRLDDE